MAKYMNICYQHQPKKYVNTIRQEPLTLLLGKDVGSLEG